MTALLIPFALKDGRIVHVDSVAGGRACRCICPACEGALIARKGRIRAHHFAHDAGANCDGESALHATAKLLLFQRIQDAIQERQEIPVVWDCSICPSGHSHKGNLLKRATNAAMEQMIPGASIRPDILLTNTPGMPIAFLEIVHTHAPDENVIQYVENNKIPLLEFHVQTVNDLMQIAGESLHPQTARIPYPICRQCGEYFCKKDKHDHCQHCGRLYDPSYGPNDGHYFCDKCQKCVDAPSDFGIYHRHCRDCGKISRYVRCYCCNIERKFGVKCSARNQPDHRHCRGCGRVLNGKGIYEFCYHCHVDNQAKGWQEWEESQREQKKFRDEAQQLRVQRQVEFLQAQARQQIEAQQERTKTNPRLI